MTHSLLVHKNILATLDRKMKSDFVCCLVKHKITEKQDTFVKLLNRASDV